MAITTYTFPTIQTSAPVGGATAANQLTQIGLETSIDSAVTSIDSKTPALGQAVMAASVPVVIASNQSAVPVSGTVTATGPLTDAELRASPVEVVDSVTVVDQIDTTPLLDVSSTNIPASASAPVQIVSSLAANVVKVVSVEDVGEFIGLYVGGVGVETLAAVLPLGGGEINVIIPSGTRVSLRHMKNSAITSGFIAINFLG